MKKLFRVDREIISNDIFFLWAKNPKEAEDLAKDIDYSLSDLALDTKDDAYEVKDRKDIPKEWLNSIPEFSERTQYKDWTCEEIIQMVEESRKKEESEKDSPGQLYMDLGIPMEPENEKS